MTHNKLRAVVCILAILVICGLVLPGCSRQQETPPPGVGSAPSASPTTIQQIGSTTILALAEKWQKAFNEIHPNVEIAVSGGGSGTGIKALLDGNAQIANASRPIKQAEKTRAKQKGIQPVEHVVAYDGIAIIVHPSNPVDKLSVEQLSDIFTGNITSWSKVGGADKQIVLISRDSSSGTYKAFEELVVTLGGTDRQRYYAPQALAVQSNQAVVASVQQSRAAIGYCSLGYLDGSVKALKVIPRGGEEAVACTIVNVQAKSYPLSRPLYMYTGSQPTGDLAAYCDYVKGPEGQAIVEQMGYVPISSLE